MVKVKSKTARKRKINSSQKLLKLKDTQKNKSDLIKEVQALKKQITKLKNLKIKTKQFESKRLKSEDKFRMITLCTPDHILIQDRQLRYALVINPQLGVY